MTRLLSPLLSIASRQGRRSIPAGQKWWSGAGSNRRPSAFQATTQGRVDQPRSDLAGVLRRVSGVIKNVDVERLRR